MGSLQRKRRALENRRAKGGAGNGAKMALAIKEAIRQGGVKSLTGPEKIMVARAMLILERLPDDYKIPVHVSEQALIGGRGG